MRENNLLGSKSDICHYFVTSSVGPSKMRQAKAPAEPQHTR